MIPTPLLFSASALFIHYERKQPGLFSLMRYAHAGMPKISMEILPHAKVRVLNQIVDLTDYKILLLASQSFLVERRFSCELIHNHIDRSFIYKFALATCVTKEDWNLLIMLWIHNPQPELARDIFFTFLRKDKGDFLKIFAWLPFFIEYLRANLEENRDNFKMSLAFTLMNFSPSTHRATSEVLMSNPLLRSLTLDLFNEDQQSVFMRLMTLGDTLSEEQAIEFALSL